MASLTKRIRFCLNGVDVVVPAEVSGAVTLLHWLRGVAGLTGTKEGCAEGDCGACTVVREEAGGGRTPLCACLLLLGQCHGARIRTIEGLGTAARPHAVQVALAGHNATQCGFCTPGIAMAAWAWTAEGGDPHEALAGNLCRCTGYRPILDALDSLAPDEAAPFDPPELASAQFAGGFHVPTTVAEALALRAAEPEAWVLAGGTDLNLRLAEGTLAPPSIISLQGIAELQRVERVGEGLSIGAAAPYASVLRAVEAHPALGLGPLRALLSRLGSRQIRGVGTLGGNLGTASPIGDMLPPLLALGATVELPTRMVAVEDFLLGYRRPDLRPGELILRIHVPAPPRGALFVCDKLSKRWDQDIAAVSLAAVVEHDGERIGAARLAFGGLGPVAARAPAAEAALVGAPFAEAAFEAAARRLEFAPVSDARGSAAYRRDAAAGLVRRLWWRR